MTRGTPYGRREEDEIAAELASPAEGWSARWEAHITRAGLWSWYIAPVKGPAGLSEPWLVIGTAARAERVARRKLARLEREDEIAANPKIITGGTP